MVGFSSRISKLTGCLRNFIVPSIICINLIIFNWGSYRYFIINEEERHVAEERNLKTTIEYLIVPEFNAALQENITHYPFALLKRFAINKHLHNRQKLGVIDLTSLYITPHSILIYTKEGQERTFELHSFREWLKRIMPPYMVYSIEINNENIATSQKFKNVPTSQNRIKIAPNVVISTQVYIDKDSSYYKNNTLRAYKKFYAILFSSIFLLAIALFAYFDILNGFWGIIGNFKDIISEKTKLNTSCVRRVKAAQKLSCLFIKKATELYLKKNIDQSQGDGTEIDRVLENIAMTNYLFPITLREKTSCDFNAKELSQELLDYFADRRESIFLKVESLINVIKIDCSKESCYQILFSMICNIMFLIENQSERAKTIKIIFDKNMIKIEYDSLPLDEETMIKYSDNFLAEYLDVFILSCDKIFNSLKEHGFKYKLFHHEGINSIQIHTSISSKFSKSTNIINIDDYLTRNPCTQTIKIDQRAEL